MARPARSAASSSPEIFSSVPRAEAFYFMLSLPQTLE